MKLISIDPSSSITGYAVMTGPMSLLEAGRLKPLPSDSSPLARIFRLADDLRSLLIEHKPEAIVIETPHGKMHRRTGPGAGAGMAIYGMAAGAQLIVCREYVRWRKRSGEAVILSTPNPNEWTHGSRKEHRQACAASDFPRQYRKADDKGGDVSDAITLGQYWFREREVRRAP